MIFPLGGVNSAFWSLVSPLALGDYRKPTALVHESV